MKRLLLLIASLPFLFASCVDEDETLGMDLIDEEDKFNVGTYSDISMDAKFFREDSLATANYQYNALGEYYDDKFGKVSSSIYSQICLSMPSAAFNSYEAIDSIVLSLSYAGGFSEDTLKNGKEMRLNIYEVSEEIDSTKKYSFDDVAIVSQPIFSENVLIDYNSDVILGSDTLDPQLRVNLTGAFFEKIRNFSGENSSFIEQFKGLKFSLEKNDRNGAMAYIDMTSKATCITVYYKQGGKNLKYLILFPQNGRRFMHYDYDFSGSDIAQLNIQDTLSGNDLIYLGNLGISMAKINIEDFRQEWKDLINGGQANNDVAINSALLEFPVNDESEINNPNFTSRILCYRQYISGNDTSLVLIHDAQSSGDALYGGTYDNKTKSYKMRITMHLANYLNGNISDPNIYLIPDARRSTATRIILNGPNHPTKPASIKITYSKN